MKEFFEIIIGVEIKRRFTFEYAAMSGFVSVKNFVSVTFRHHISVRIDKEP